MTPADNARLAAIIRRFGNVAPGPWRVEGFGNVTDTNNDPVIQIQGNRFAPGAHFSGNYAFFAHLYADLDWLLALVADMRGVLGDKREEAGER